MQTTWGEIAVRDAHVHFLSRRFLELLRDQRPQPRPGETPESMAAGLGWEAPPFDPAELGARWAAELDRHGVERAVLIASAPGDEESVAAALRAYPDRFWGFCFLNPLAADALDRARRAFDELGFRGLCLFPAMQRFSVQDQRLRPLFQLAADRPGTVVFVHMGVLTVGVRQKLGLPSLFDVSRSSPLELHPVALEYPTANFVLPHFGAGLFREALMLADLCPNVYLDTSSSNSWRKYLCPEPSMAAVFEQALAVAGPDRLLFGTDSSFFPRGWHRPVLDAQLEALAATGADRAAVEKILGGNLLRLLGPGA